jgi:hypothetical protein
MLRSVLLAFFQATFMTPPQNNSSHEHPLSTLPTLPPAQLLHAPFDRLLILPPLLDVSFVAVAWLFLLRHPQT